MRQCIVFLSIMMVGLFTTNCKKQADPSWEFSTLPASVKTNFFDRERGEHVLVDPDYKIWGLSVIKWKDGKYHAYYSRWPDSPKPGCHIPKLLTLWPTIRRALSVL